MGAKRRGELVELTPPLRRVDPRDGGADAPNDRNYRQISPNYAEPSAARTRSGVSGYCRSLTPVASKNALPIAATTAGNTSSPAPLLG
jgi:hypothetical protein